MCAVKPLEMDLIRVQVPNGGNSFFTAIAICLHHHSTKNLLSADGAQRRGEALRAQLLAFASRNVDDDLVKYIFKRAYAEGNVTLRDRDRPWDRVSYEELYEGYFEILSDAESNCWGGNVTIDLFSLMSRCRVNVMFPQPDGTNQIDTSEYCKVVNPPELYILLSQENDIDALLPSSGGEVYRISRWNPN